MYPQFSLKSDTELLSSKIRRISTHPWRIMEVCGGQTNSIIRYNLNALLPNTIELVHGPGCPVCVTPAAIVDKAIALAMRNDTVLLTFGDMMRVSGSNGDTLLDVRSRGEGEIKILYSPLDALSIAKNMPEKEIVFLAVGFETTAPIYAIMLLEAEKRKIHNLSIISSLFTIPAAINMIGSDPECRIDGILAAGHVCCITGEGDYIKLSEKLKKPIVITGFEPSDIMLGIYHCIEMLENRTPALYNAYRRAVGNAGNIKAKKDLYEVFEPSDKEWRGIGKIPQSGLKLRSRYEHYDALSRFLTKVESHETTLCCAGDIMCGKISVHDCPYFGKQCTPEHPMGAAMISTEGVCIILYNYAL
ncbi:MAG: hydrogenase formation protein HypD [Bacteroidales bacterium]